MAEVSRLQVETALKEYVDPYLEKDLAKARTPIRLDPRLVALREASADSSNQMKNKRLTAIQDLAWALINSSAFLFNH